MRKKIRIGLALGVLTLFAAGGLYYWWHQSIYPTTSNAYVGGNVIRVAPLVSGEIDAVYVLENQYVRTGQPLLAIDNQPFDLAVAEARTAFDNAAQKAGSDADDLEKAVEKVDDAEEKKSEAIRTYAFAAARFNSVSNVANSGQTAEADLEKALNDLKTAQQELDNSIDGIETARKEITKTDQRNIALRSATTKLQRALFERSLTEIRATRSGWLTNFEIRPGHVVKTGQPLFALVEDNDRWIEANFKETDLDRLRIGQPVEIRVDMYPDMELNGKVESFSGGSGAVFSTLPPENATGNWVKITQRFTVRISVDDFPYARSRPLRIGASAEVTVDTSGLDGE